MPDDPFRDTDLVHLYDEDNPDGPDHDFYRALADRLDARTIVDLGCGTGLLTRSLATGDRRVVGVDPSRTMLDHARDRPGAKRVEWVLGDAGVLPQDGTVDLVVCTGNAVMQLDDEAFSATCHRVAAALRPGGVLAFESRNPLAKQWQSWNRANTYGERVTRFGHLQEWLDVVDTNAARVTFDAHNIIDGVDRVYRNTLYFRSEAILSTVLSMAGFSVQVDGGWHAEPVSAVTKLLVYRAVLS